MRPSRGRQTKGQACTVIPRSWCVLHGLCPWRGVGRAPWAETPDKNRPRHLPWAGAFSPGPGAYGGSEHSSWLCFRRNPVENASEHIIHVRPSRSRPKTISQPFRGIYSGLSTALAGVDVPVRPHAIQASRAQWYSSFPTGFRTSLSRVPIRRNGNHQPIQFHTVLGLIQVPPGSGQQEFWKPTPVFMREWRQSII